MKATIQNSVATFYLIKDPQLEDRLKFCKILVTSEIKKKKKSRYSINLTKKPDLSWFTRVWITTDAIENKRLRIIKDRCPHAVVMDIISRYWCKRRPAGNGVLYYRKICFNDIHSMFHLAPSLFTRYVESLFQLFIHFWLFIQDSHYYQF